MCYLTGYELWKERDLQFLWKAWWVLFVFILNILGFALFWIWLLIRRTRARRRLEPSRLACSARTRCSRTSFSASSSDSRSSLERSRSVTRSMRSSRWRTVFGCTNRRSGRGGDSAAVGEEPLERVDETGVAAAVVLDQLLHRLAIAVARRLVELQVDEVAVGTELLVRDRASLG